MMLPPPPFARASALQNNPAVPAPRKPLHDAATPLASPLQGAHLSKEAHLREGGVQQMRLFERQYAIMTTSPANFLDQKVCDAPLETFPLLPFRLGLSPPMLRVSLVATA
jgi:hypothetical protein